VTRRKQEPRAFGGRADIDRALSQKSDFAFEMAVLAKLDGFSVDRFTHRVEHSGTYTDPITSKVRQYDIRYRGRIAGTRFSLAIECKNVRPECPLVVHAVPRRPSEAFHDIVYYSKESSKRRWLNDPVCKRHEGIYTPYSPSAIVGKAIDQVQVSGDEFTLGDSEVFEKWNQSVNSLTDLIIEGVQEADDMWLRVFLPVLVVPEERLWVATYNEVGQRSEEALQHSRVSFFLNRTWTCGWANYLTYIPSLTLRSLLPQAC